MMKLFKRGGVVQFRAGRPVITVKRYVKRYEPLTVRFEECGDVLCTWQCPFSKKKERIFSQWKLVKYYHPAAAMISQRRTHKRINNSQVIQKGLLLVKNVVRGFVVSATPGRLFFQAGTGPSVLDKICCDY